MSLLRVLILSGSSRPGSYNGRLATLAHGLLESAGAQPTRLDLRALALPIYDAEVEVAGLPPGALALRDAFAAHDALLVTTPEYNGFPTPLLINSFDWLSRVSTASGGPAGLAVLAGKPVGVLGASPGPLGGVRSLMFTRQFFHNVLGMLVLPEQFALSQAMNAFDDGGRLRDEKHLQAVQRVVSAVVRVGSAVRVAAA
jgi:chromate reductase, NAD(P)H dehydrogenase (quinone)